MREFQVLFFTHTGAIRFERKVRGNVHFCSLMPVPRALSSNCSVSANVLDSTGLDDFIDDQIEKVFEKIGDRFHLLYECKE